MSSEQSLYAIESNIYNLIEFCEKAETEEELDAATEALDIAYGELELKTQNYLYFIQQRESYNEQIDKEIKRLQDMKKKRAKICATLKEKISEALQKHGYEKLELPLFSLSFRKSTAVDDYDTVPAEYQRQVIKVEPDKKLILKDLKAGKDIPGARLITKKNLQIK